MKNKLINYDLVYIRKATEKDIDEIMKIEYACFDEDTVEDANVYLQRINIFSDGFLLLEYDTKIIGMISSEIWNYSEAISVESFYLGHDITARHKKLGDELYISSLAVLPEYQGYKIGETLFIELLNQVTIKYPLIKYYILLVCEKWMSARNIYIKNGFKECVVYPNFFGGNRVDYSNGIVMRKNI